MTCNRVIWLFASMIRASGTTDAATISRIHTAWASWIQIENFSAWHNLPLGTKANGLEGTDTVLNFNNPTVARHIANLAEAQIILSG